MIPQMLCAGAICAWIISMPKLSEFKSQRNALPLTMELDLSQECEAMNAEGKIQQIVEEINENAEKHQKLRFRNIEEDTEEAKNLRQEISENVAKAKSILRPEWTESKWQYDASWDINFQDEDGKPILVMNKYFAFKGIDLVSVSLGGVEREDLYPLIQSSVDSNNIQVKITKRASSLELCQLQNTFSIAAKVNYKFQNKKVFKTTLLTLKPGAKRTITIISASRRSNLFPPAEPLCKQGDICIDKEQIIRSTFRPLPPQPRPVIGDPTYE